MNALYRFLVPDNALRVPWVEHGYALGMETRVVRDIHGRARRWWWAGYWQ